jgi:hypothetical protein
LGRPSISDWAPVEMMTASATTVGSPVGSPTQTANGRPSRSTFDTFWVRRSAPKRSAWARIRVIRSGPITPSGKPGKFSTSVVSIS